MPDGFPKWEDALRSGHIRLRDFYILEQLADIKRVLSEFSKILEVVLDENSPLRKPSTDQADSST